jgi:hypothetical protein
MREIVKQARKTTRIWWSLKLAEPSTSVSPFSRKNAYTCDGAAGFGFT